MADPNSKAADLQRTYLLMVPVHDLMGDSPTVQSPVTMRLLRTDDHSTAPLFGPQGLIAGSLSQFNLPAVPRDPSMISAGEHQFRLIPNEYYFVPTKYVVTVGGRSYTFVMPTADSNLIELLDGEVSGGGVVPQPVVPQPGGGTVMPQSRGLFIVWDQPTAVLTVIPANRVAVPIYYDRAALVWAPSNPSYDCLAYPADLESEFVGIWNDYYLGNSVLAASFEANPIMDGGVDYKVYISPYEISFDLAVGIVELVLQQS